MDDKLKIILVDESDNPIWFWEKMDVHKRWLLHRAVSILIMNIKELWINTIVDDCGVMQHVRTLFRMKVVLMLLIGDWNKKCDLIQN